MVGVARAHEQAKERSRIMKGKIISAVWAVAKWIGLGALMIGLILLVGTLATYGQTWVDSKAYVTPNPASSLANVRACNYNSGARQVWGYIKQIGSGTIVGDFFNPSGYGCVYVAFRYGSLPNGTYLVDWYVQWQNGSVQYIDQDYWVLLQ